MTTRPTERSLGERLAALSVPPPPSDLAARLTAEIPDGLRAPEWTRPRPPKNAWPLVFPRLGVAASLAVHAAVLGVALLGGWLLRGAVNPRASMPAFDAAAAPGYVNARAVPLSDPALEAHRAGFARDMATTDVELERIERLVAAFDGLDAVPAADGYALVAEGAPSPFDDGGATRIMRLGARGPQGANAQLQVEWDPERVERYRLFGYEELVLGRDPYSASNAPPPGGGVSALYELELQRTLGDGRIATLRARFRRSGDTVVRSREVKVSDFVPRWEDAPRSLQLATIAARYVERAKAGAADGAADAPSDARLVRAAQRVADAWPGDEAAGTLARRVRASLGGPLDGRGDDPATGSVAVKLAEATEPEALTRVAPEYPAALRGTGRAGTVLLAVTVDETGRIDAIDVVRSVPGLDQAAIAAVRRWTFRPAEYEGQRVRGSVTVGIEFSAPVR